MKTPARLVIGLVVLLALAGGAALAYLQLVPDRSRYPMRGIDVSHHQGRIDWTRVASDDVAFVYLKATEGGDHVDDAFARNVAEARQAGLAVGAYHFLTFCKPGDEQARNFVSAVPRDGPLLPPVVDIEFGGNCSARPSVEEFRGELATFLATVEGAFGQPAIVYLIGEAAAEYGAAVPVRQRWVRSLFWPPFGEPWLFWQYHNAGRVAGIDGDVDLNVLNGDAASLKALQR